MNDDVARRSRIDATGRVDRCGIMCVSTKTGERRANGLAHGTEGVTSMQAESTEGLVLRTARKSWECHGSGGRPNRHADDCPGIIEPGTQYVESFWFSPAYQSGDRISMPCARAFFGWPA
jgi:hypothetical protein